MYGYVKDMTVSYQNGTHVTFFEYAMEAGTEILQINNGIIEKIFDVNFGHENIDIHTCNANVFVNEKSNNCACANTLFGDVNGDCMVTLKIQTCEPHFITLLFFFEYFSLETNLYSIDYFLYTCRFCIACIRQ